MTEIKVHTLGGIHERCLLEVQFLLTFLPYVHPAAYMIISFIYSKLIFKKIHVMFLTPGNLMMTLYSIRLKAKQIHLPGQ